MGCCVLRNALAAALLLLVLLCKGDHINPVITPHDEPRILKLASPPALSIPA